MTDQLHLAAAAAPGPATPYLTVEEAAAMARCGEKTIRRAFTAGELRAFKPAGRVLLREEDVRAWVEARAAVDVDQPQPRRARPRRARPGSVSALRALEQEMTS